MQINRPNYDDYDDTPYEQSIYPYCRDLEDYCDYLENKLHNACLNANYLDKALNEACSYLFSAQRCSFFEDIKLLEESEWKERLLGHANK